MHLSLGQGPSPNDAVDHCIRGLSPPKAASLSQKPFHAKFNLFLFPFPYLLSKNIPGFEQESLSHKEKGYALSFTHRTTEL